MLQHRSIRTDDEPKCAKTEVQLCTHQELRSCQIHDSLQPFVPPKLRTTTTAPNEHPIVLVLVALRPPRQAKTQGTSQGTSQGSLVETPRP